ncbi:B-cell receptor CD22-like isoform X2 [Carassius auratus]|uniref:B-cell receptor CD22-like isoform X2 n=1 Tax=Carassius auratus TaxID=7957 RepID=A0A6P6PKZ3_CARAU|nr:B-cell receptor CD22-like isoform X2 [Carassius auratus]
MGSGALPLILLLMSFIHAGLTQESPKAVLKVTPDERVFRGETVTLTCDIQGAGHIQWTYSWFRNGYTFYPHTTTATAEYSFRADVSSSGEYSCRGDTYNPQRSSDTSSAVTLTVSDSSRSSLTVTPDKTVFTGETVNLKCVIETYSYSNREWRWRIDQTYNWRYEWYKDTDSVMLQTSDRYTVNRDTLTIRGVITSDQGQYWCRGPSSAVYLSVKDSPRSSLTVTPDSPVFTGETVNLTCVIESHSNWRQRNGLTYDWRYDWTYYQTSKWRYEWYKDPDSVMLQTSDRYTVNRDTLTIRGVITSDQGQYWCRGRRDQRPNSSQSRSAVSLTVTDSPRSSLTVTPDSPVFTGETVNLTCVIGIYSDWRYEWYKDTDSVMLQTSDGYTVNRDTLTIRGVITSDQGQYWCRGQRDQRPNSSQSRSAVSLTVTDSPRSSLTVTPDSPVFTGETVNLKCVIESNHSNWRYEWYKDTDSVMLQTSDRYTVNRDTLTIRGVITSDQGQYWCRGQIRSVSSQSTSAVSLIVTASSSLLVTAVVVGSSVFLLIFISLLLLWRYKKNKDQQSNINQTSVPNQSAESQPENFPLQSADPDHVYDDVTEVKKRHKDDPETTDVTYSEILWSYVDKDVSMAESNDVTYSEVIKKVKKCKDADAGVGDATYASVRKKGP